MHCFRIPTAEGKHRWLVTFTFTRTRRFESPRLLEEVVLGWPPPRFPGSSEAETVRGAYALGVADPSALLGALVDGSSSIRAQIGMYDPGGSGYLD